jgi:hypothetical protein
MRFMIMHKMTDELEKGVADPAIIQAVGNLVAEAVKDKSFVSGEGLKPSSERVHIAYERGKRTITDGPFTEAKELVGGFALMRVRSRDEALMWCDKFAALVGDVRVYMGPVVEPWDLGIAPRPKNPPLRMLSMHQLDESAASDAPPDPELMKKMDALVAEMKRAGVLQATDGLAGTKHGARVHFEAGKHRVIDGPFAESKELVAGYAILNLPSKAAAIEWAIRFGKIVKVHEVEVRMLPEW